MSEDKRTPVPASAGDEAKAERLAAALRANLKRRKAQARAKDEPAQAAEPPREPDSEQ
jgi:hypothetical protein